MNLQQYLQVDGRVIFKTDIIYSHINFDKRSNYKQRNKQLEIIFNESSDKTERIFHSSTVTFTDLRILKSTVDSLDKIYKPITNSLLTKFPKIYFELMLNDENKSVVENYLHFIACFKNGTPLTISSITDIREYLFEVFNQIDDIINKINKTTYIKDISSVKLVNQDNGIPDHIKYENRGAAEFVHALFNSDLKDLSLATLIKLNQDPITLTKPIQQDQKVFLDRPHIIKGTLDIESKISKKLHAKGFYLDENASITNKPFNEMIYCKASGENKEIYEDLFRLIDNELCGREVSFMVKTLQPYVCIEGIESKTKHLISVDNM